MVFDSMWLIAVLIVILASGLQAVTGFGFGLVAVPLFLLIFDAKSAVGLSMMISFFSVTRLAVNTRKFIIPSLVKNLLSGALFGIPLGIFIFYHVNMTNLKFLISIIVILLSSFLISGYRFKVKDSIWVDRIIGSISGVLTSCIGMPGPPIILFLNNKELSKDGFRATFACYNSSVYVPSIIFLFFLGSLHKIIILKALTLIPFAFLGGFVGSRIFPYVSQAHFQKGVPILVLLTAIYSLLSTL
ncbi:MAG: sulfite exporter TauE/SafE family protein [Peptococcaceae bacterium]